MRSLNGQFPEHGCRGLHTVIGMSDAQSNHSAGSARSEPDPEAIKFVWYEMGDNIWHDAAIIKTAVT